MAILAHPHVTVTNGDAYVRIRSTMVMLAFGTFIIALIGLFVKMTKK
ncbi:putative holin-like toxin [Brevibacillus laterosporus]